MYTNCLADSCRKSVSTAPEFDLSVRFVCHLLDGNQSEVELHVKCFSEEAEKAGDKFRAVVRGDMFWNTMFEEHMHNEQHFKVFRSAVDGQSTITRIELQLEDIRRVSMKSIEMEFHGHSGIRSCFSKP